ncbi:MAG: hypothetical protein IJW16_05940 [Clostridia bacterium]|nr:hypothetical protein [Clostridia bacterium]
MTKSRWLKINSPSGDNSKNMLAVVETIENAEIKTIDGQTYVRFVVVTSKSSKSTRKRFLFNVFKKESNSSAMEEDGRHYCAIMLK